MIAGEALTTYSAFLQEEVSPEEWRKVGKKALEHGKYLSTLKCFEKIGNRAGIEETRKKLDEMKQGQEASK